MTIVAQNIFARHILQNIGGVKTMFGKKKKANSKKNVEASNEQSTKNCSGSSNKTTKNCK